MAGASLLALLDDIATILDDVAVMTKVAAKKTAGVLADLLADGKRKGQAAAGAGAYFGVWNFVNKFNLALAAGIALPLVALFGYKVGAGDTASQGLLALAATYALLPAAIKVVSLLLLWRWRHHFGGSAS